MGCDLRPTRSVSGGDGRQERYTVHRVAASRRCSIASPAFEAMGKNITLVGGTGDGQTRKVANQIVVALTINAVAEGLQQAIAKRRR